MRRYLFLASEFLVTLAHSGAIGGMKDRNGLTNLSL